MRRDGPRDKRRTRACHRQTGMKIARYTEFARGLGFKPRVAVTVIALSLIGTVFEGVGLTMLLPVFQYIQSEGDLAGLSAQSGIWVHLIGAYGFLGMPVNLATLLGTSFIAILSRQVFIYMRLIYMARARLDLTFIARNLGFNLYLRAGAAYHEQARQGDMVNDLTTELQRAIGTLFGTLMLVGYAMIGLVYVVIVGLLSPLLTMVTLVVGLLIALSLGRVFRRSEQFSRQVVEANRHMSSFFLERLRAARLVRLSGMESAEAKAMNRLTGRQRETLFNIAILLARLEVIIEPLVVGFGFAFLYLGVAVFELPFEEIGLFLVIVLRLLPIMKEALRQRQSVLGTLGSLEAVYRRLESMREARDVVGGTRPFTRLDSGIEIDSFRFDYGRGSPLPALDGLTLQIPAHKMTALVGPSGAGKSTLVDMLPRMRDPDSGRILLDDIPIESFDLTSLRAGISYVPQEAQIFNVSAVEHIRYGKAEATLEEIKKAARLAGADVFLNSLPEGYDTLLGENGQRLSGGQRQRLDLARGLVARAPILILDEPTSNLDADSETAFREALSRIRREIDVTIVIIGHRLSTVANADQIVVLDEGRAIESGTHAALLACGGWYARAWAQQQRFGPDSTPIAGHVATAQHGMGPETVA